MRQSRSTTPEVLARLTRYAFLRHVGLAVAHGTVLVGTIDPTRIALGGFVGSPVLD